MILLGDHWPPFLQPEGSSLHLKRKLPRSGQVGTVPDDLSTVDECCRLVQWYSEATT